MNTKIKKFLKKASCFEMGTLAFVGAAFAPIPCNVYASENFVYETQTACVLTKDFLNYNHECQCQDSIMEESSRTMDSSASVVVQEYLQDPEKYASKESEKKTIADHILDGVQFVLKEVKEITIAVFTYLFAMQKKLCDKFVEKITDLFVDEEVDKIKKKRKKKHKKSKRK
mgnify:CR=1 FL=1